MACRASDAAQKLLNVVLKTLDDDKAEDIVSIDLSNKSPMADFMVVASGRSNRHVSAIAEHLTEELSEEPSTAETVKHVLEHNQSSDTFPISLRDMASNKDIQSLRESQVIVWDEDGVRVHESSPSPSPEAVVIRIHKSYAHPGGVYHYRIEYQGKSVVYATDTEGYVGMDRKLIHFSRNADVLIHDAQYSDDHYYGALAGFPSTQGYGHSTATMAGQVAASAETGQLILFHHDPSYMDDWVTAQESAAQHVFPDSYAAYEGLTIGLSKPTDETENRERGSASKVSREREVKYVTHG